MKRPIAIGLSPNTQRDDYTAALQIIVKPKLWQQGESTEKVTAWFKSYFSVPYAVSFNAGRSALLGLLKAMEIGQGDEVLLQAYTCVAVPNSVIWAGATPVYVDIDASLNIDVIDAEKKITRKTRALIVQHTFGIPANMSKITAFCKSHKLLLIEDCAHALGARYKETLIGTSGDAAFFSFGRDKVISAVFGGIAITKHEEIGKKLQDYQKGLAYPSMFWIFQQLLHPIISSLVLAAYSIMLGKVLLYSAQRLHLLSFPVYPEEKQAKKPADFPKQLPNALAFLVLTQLAKLEKYNARRKKIARTYFSELKTGTDILPEDNEGALYLRFNIQSVRAAEIRFQAKQQGIILGNWYSSTIDPRGVNFERIHYTLKSCPKAEIAAEKSVNLPTYPTLSDAQVKVVVAIIKKNQYYRNL